MKTKVCTKCKTEYSAILKNFGPHKRTKDKLQSWCRICRNKVQRISGKKYYKCNREHIKAMAKKYRNTVKGRLRMCYGQITWRCGDPVGQSACYKNIKNLFRSSDELINYVVDVLKIDPRGKQIHRINNKGHYEPGNITFMSATNHEQLHVAER